jgi:hypothetical protein
MDRRIIWTERASGDIEAIVRYISRRNPQAASAIGYGIYQRAQILEELRDGGWRKLIYRRWSPICFTTWPGVSGPSISIACLNTKAGSIRTCLSGYSLTWSESGNSIADQLIQKGRQEGMARGSLVGRIQAYQELLNLPVSGVAELEQKDPSELETLWRELQAELRRRLT